VLSSDCIWWNGRCHLLVRGCVFVHFEGFQYCDAYGLVKKRACAVLRERQVLRAIHSHGQQHGLSLHDFPPSPSHIHAFHSALHHLSFPSYHISPFFSPLLLSRFTPRSSPLRSLPLLLPSTSLPLLPTPHWAPLRFVPLPPINLPPLPLFSLLSIDSFSAFVSLDPVRFSSTWAFTVCLSFCSGVFRFQCFSLVCLAEVNNQ